VSIRYKVILPYLFLTLLIAVTGAYVVINLVSRSLEERLSNQLLEAGRVFSDSMVQQELAHVKTARLIAYTRGVGEAVEKGDIAQLALLAKPSMGSSNIESLVVYDLGGHEVLHFIRESNSEITDALPQSGAPTLSMVTDLIAEKNTDSLPKRTLTTDTIDKRYYYVTLLPVAYDGRVVGALAVGTSLNTLLPQLKKTTLADIVLYDKNGQAIASTLGALGTENLYARTISISPELYQEVVNNDETVQGANITVDERWYRTAMGPFKIADDRLAVFSVVLPSDFVVSSNSTNRNNYIVLYSVAMIAVILIGYAVARVIITPLSKLVQTSRAISDGDLTMRARIKSNDEIGVLANTFDTMTEHLQQRTLELEKTNKILEQMDRAKMRFIQVAAHELRTPLTLVQGYAQMVHVKSNESNQFTKYTNGILDGTGRMVEIIDSMLDVSRIDTNQLEVMPALVELNAIIQKVQKFFAIAFEERRIRFVVEGLENLPPIQADKDLLYKVFYHVIGNAIKYTPDGGCVTVRGSLNHENGTKSQVEVSVQDTGIGIDPENQELVFEKFYQTGEVLLHSSGKTKFKGGGPGLGLAIARGIVNAHGGRIWLESPGHDEATNPGTTVYVRLPIHGSNNASA
jgi:signal transduction histidine kinase